MNKMNTDDTKRLDILVLGYLRKKFRKLPKELEDLLQCVTSDDNGNQPRGYPTLEEIFQFYTTYDKERRVAELKQPEVVPGTLPPEIWNIMLRYSSGKDLMSWRLVGQNFNQFATAQIRQRYESFPAVKFNDDERTNNFIATMYSRIQDILPFAAFEFSLIPRYDSLSPGTVQVFAGHFGIHARSYTLTFKGEMDDDVLNSLIYYAPNLEKLHVYGNTAEDATNYGENILTLNQTTSPLRKLRSLVVLQMSTSTFFDFVDRIELLADKTIQYDVLQNWISNCIQCLHVGFPLPISSATTRDAGYQFLNSIRHLNSIGLYIIMDQRQVGKDFVLDWFIQNKPRVETLALQVYNPEALTTGNESSISKCLQCLSGTLKSLKLKPSRLNIVIPALPYLEKLEFDFWLDNYGFPVVELLETPLLPAQFPCLTTVIIQGWDHGALPHLFGGGGTTFETVSRLWVSCCTSQGQGLEPWYLIFPNPKHLELRRNIIRCHDFIGIRLQYPSLVSLRLHYLEMVDSFFDEGASIINLPDLKYLELQVVAEDGSMTHVIEAFLQLSAMRAIQALEYLGISAPPDPDSPLEYGDQSDEWKNEEELIQSFQYHKQVRIRRYNYEEEDELRYNELFGSSNPYVW